MELTHERPIRAARGEARSAVSPPFFLPRRLTAMTGTKIHDFAPVSDLSLEELVPKNNFYCH
jgi:hypothetical protein